jgi:hypothetical protein
MKSKLLFIASGVALLAGFATLAAGWHGTLGISLASPMSGSVFQFCGKATGGWAIGGIAGILMALVLFIAALVSLIARAAAGPDPKAFC